MTPGAAASIDLRRLGADRGPEWLLADGLGGFAMGTLSGVPARTYHAWLVAARRPPIDRVVALHSAAERLEQDHAAIELTAWEFGAGRHRAPAASPCWDEVEVDPAAATIAWRCVRGTLSLERRLRLRRGEAALDVVYRVRGLLAPARLSWRPLVPLRSIHEGSSAPADGAPPFRTTVDRTGGGVRIADPVSGAAVRLRCLDPHEWCDEPEWWRDFRHELDAERGLRAHEDLPSPGRFLVPLPAHEETVVRFEARLEDAPCAAPPPMLDPPAGVPPRLAAAARQFVVRRREGDAWRTSIIAGYPWFADWGRDAMIALPGLVLAFGALDEAAEILAAFAHRVRRGLLPNSFHDDAETTYHAVDAPLWFIHAVGAYLDAGGVRERDRLLEACAAIDAAYRAGTDYGIAMDDDALVRCGDGGQPLTWMDAKRDGVAFTPREGKPVEIQALWHRAQRVLARHAPTPAARRAAESLALRVRRAFAAFRRADELGLHDRLVRGDDGAWDGDDVRRPNQILAAALDDDLLDADARASVIDAVRAHLLVPVGLRTLDPVDAAYRGRFEGDLMQRDAAYHQGTAWPWLLGPFAAALRRQRDDASVRNEIRALFAPLLARLDDACIGQVPEVYDADPPHRPGGCVAQAWSVAVMVEQLHAIDG